MFKDLEDERVQLLLRGGEKRLPATILQGGGKKVKERAWSSEKKESWKLSALEGASEGSVEG